MQIEYLQINGSDQHVNVDIYEPAGIDRTLATKGLIPAVVIAAGGGGKDLLSGNERRGKHAVGYHDLAEYLAGEGFWVLVPSRRGDPQRTPELRSTLSHLFTERLPCEFFLDHGPNVGNYSHQRQANELKTVIERLPELCGRTVDVTRVGLLGKSAGCGVSLCVASAMGERVAALALWCGSLKSSQWFSGPKADDFFKGILSDRQIRYERAAFVNDICDAVEFVGGVHVPILFACTLSDSYGSEPTERDPYATAEEQLQLLHYAVNAHYARVTIIKGAEHTMYRELPAWRSYTLTLGNWFKEVLMVDGGDLKEQT